MIFESILETVGKTPTVHIRHMAANINAQIYLKLEGFNPTSSIKDRTAVYMIEQAELKGLLVPGGTIIESTSGNFGKSLAMIGAARGYSVLLVVDSKTSKSTLAFYEALGAQVDIVNEPAEDGSLQKARIRRVQELIQQIPDSYWPNQYDNPLNPNAHAVTTALEVLNDFPELDVLVASVSTGGHISGIAQAVKRRSSSTDIIAVDAVGSSIFRPPYAPYLMSGIGLSWLPGNLNLDQIDYLHFVSDVEAFSSCRLLAKNEGILVGGSGGAVLFTCLYVASNEPKYGTIVGIVPDSGVNYLEQFYNDSWLLDNNVELVLELDTLLAAAGSNRLELPSQYRI